MAEFDGMFCCPFLLSVLIIKGVGDHEMGAGQGEVMGRGGWGGREVAKTNVWDTP